jgi:hypothetical protein
MSLLRLMLREEYRLHTSYSSKRTFLAIPLFVFLLAMMVSLTLSNIQGTISLRDLIINLNGGVFLYGMSVGAFGFLGKSYVERRQGKQNFIVAMPALLPMSYRSTFRGMYLRDMIFYLALILGPAFLGLLSGGLIVNHSIASMTAVFVTMILSFLLGISLSFMVSVIGSRSKAAFFVIVAVIITLIVGFGVFHLYGIEAIVLPIGFQYTLPPFGGDLTSGIPFLISTLLLVTAFSALAVALVPETFEGEAKIKGPRTETYSSYLPKLAFTRSYRPMLAKEIVDLQRSGTLGKMVFTFIAPLTFLSFTTWYVNNGLNVPVGFNIVFYAAMVGFFGVLLYSWLTNMDLVDYYETLPVNVPTVIRSKLFIFLLLSLSISTAFVLAISLLNNETRLLWLALPVLYVTSIFMGVAMSYLTGLHPNSFLFNPDVLFKFSLASVLPDICLTILSFSLDRDPLLSATAIIVVLGFLTLLTVVLFRRLDRKWSATGFN